MRNLQWQEKYVDKKDTKLNSEFNKEEAKT